MDRQCRSLHQQRRRAAKLRLAQTRPFLAPGSLDKRGCCCPGRSTQPLHKIQGNALAARDLAERALLPKGPPILTCLAHAGAALVPSMHAGDAHHCLLFVLPQYMASRAHSCW